MQLENGSLHLFALSDLEWEHFLGSRYSKINNVSHLEKRPRMIFCTAKTIKPFSNLLKVLHEAMIG